MKKIISLILALVMIMALATGCGSKAEEKWPAKDINIYITQWCIPFFASTK